MDVQFLINLFKVRPHGFNGDRELPAYFLVAISAAHPIETPVNEVYICTVFSARLWLVERTVEDGARDGHRPETYCQSECAGDADHYKAKKVSGLV
ncbi:MAG: hypothetical protein JWR26_3365 [Pedosphaera sp.]|nr:hypothetical protein [Pedosphaera sp.]